MILRTRTPGVGLTFERQLIADWNAITIVYIEHWRVGRSRGVIISIRIEKRGARS